MRTERQHKSIAEIRELDPAAVLDAMVDDGIRPSNPGARERGRDLIASFVQDVADQGIHIEQGVTEAINHRIAALDELIGRQLDQVLHHPEFQKLESTWRGLHKLVMGSETGEHLKIRVLNVSKKELLRDFQGATEFTESALWKKVYEEEYGTWGGDPYAALVGDYEFGRSTPDIELITRMSEVAHAAHAPFIAAAGPQMFGFESFAQLPDPRDLQKIFDRNNPENTKWLAFREHEDARAVALVMPHTLRRAPYDPEENPIDAFTYAENIELHEDYLWGNAAYDLAGRLTDAFAKYRWCVAIRGPEGGGLVEDLPIHSFRTREGPAGAKCPTEVTIPETREKELSDLGFLALINRKNTDEAAFFSASSCRKPKKYNKAAATASDRLGCQIQYAMATSRIAHYLKCICRDKVGSFMSRAEAETYLNDWVQEWVLDMDDGSQEAKAERPLREARIIVHDDKARPGCYKAEALLRPHFQLDEISVTLRLVAELPEAKG